VKTKICVTGSINKDIILRTPHIPKPGETISASAFDWAFGGKGANQAVSACRLGADVSFIGAVGRDDTGQEQIEHFKDEGMVVSGIEQVDEASGAAYIAVDNKGENTIILYPGANNSVTPEWVRKNKDLIEKSDCLLLQLEIPAEASLEAARIAGAASVPVIFNPAPVNEFPEELFGLCHMITPNETELEILTGSRNPEEGARILMEKGVKSVLVTLGKEGCYYTDGSEELRSPSVDLYPVADTTAAGDSFNAAMAFFLKEDRTMADKLNLSNRVGALTVSRKGAQPSLPTYEELKKHSGGLL